MIRAAEAATPAMVGAANALFDGKGVEATRGARSNGRCAPRTPASRAKFSLGRLFSGYWVFDPQADRPHSLSADHTQALLWSGRAAEDNVPGAQYNPAT